MTRPSIERTMLDIAAVIAKRSTCRRRAVGCVLTDDMNRILSVGHNGVPPGVIHCIDKPCPGAEQKSGQGLDLCEASHAEANALLFCGDTSRVHKVYCTVSPCLACVKLLLMTQAQHIVFEEEYPHELARERWINGPLRGYDLAIHYTGFQQPVPKKRYWTRYIG